VLLQILVFTLVTSENLGIRSRCVYPLHEPNSLYPRTPPQPKAFSNTPNSKGPTMAELWLLALLIIIPMLLFVGKLKSDDVIMHGQMLTMSCSIQLGWLSHRVLEIASG
jgi:hypothetical protein